MSSTAPGSSTRRPSDARSATRSTTPSWPGPSPNSPRSVRPGTPDCGASRRSPRRSRTHDHNSGKKDTTMADILHRIGATATPDQVYDALTTVDGLAAWWTTDTQGDSAPGGTIQFRFGDTGGGGIKGVAQGPRGRGGGGGGGGDDESGRTPL